MKPLSLLFFYLVGEEHYDEQSDEVLGYIRIVDLAKTKTIDKVEVSRLRETFSHLRECLQKIANPVENHYYPQSDQCFAIEWAPDTIEQLAQKENSTCLICREIATYIDNYHLFLRESGRHQAVG